MTSAEGAFSEIFIFDDANRTGLRIPDLAYGSFVTETKRHKCLNSGQERGLERAEHSPLLRFIVAFMPGSLAC